jgi:hypothetical protein
VLLAVVHLPPSFAALDAAGVKSLAAAIGLSPADVRMRLSGILPRILLSECEAGDLTDAAAALQRLNVATAICDPKAVPTDDERVIGRRLSIAGDVLQIEDGAGTTHEIPRAAVGLLQRGLRATSETRTVTTTHRKFDAGRALLSGGLMLTKKSTQTATTTTETRDLFLLVQRRDGGDDVILYERRLDYRFLGADMQPASRANFDRLVARVRGFCPRAPFDERVAQTSFVNALPSTSADPTDLGLHLVALAVARTAEFSG